ncbi:MAG: fumarylacetoacetate hydrolase family protein [Muribaculaceae bacterium]|nr:fumarylacetoacetate hydrolase family protein [Muribaculaceae bacterium]
MKIFVVDENNSLTPPEGWYFLPDSSLTNAGKPFFIPENTQVIEAHPVMAVKVSRLGKTISPRFSGRYFEEVAVGIHFTAPLLKTRLLEKGLSPDRAHSFDRSLILSPFLQKSAFTDAVPVRMLKNGEKIFEWVLDFSEQSLGSVFSAVSAENTLKMGDIIIPFLPGGPDVEIGDVIELNKMDDDLLRIEIR